MAKMPVCRVLVLLGLLSLSAGFTPSTGRRMRPSAALATPGMGVGALRASAFVASRRPAALGRMPRRGRGAGMRMMFDYGILNISGPEGVVILAVGWYLLGPTELYKLAKSVGAVIGNLTSLAKNAASTFVDSMENEIVAQELGLSDPNARPVQSFFDKAFQDGLNEAEQVMPAMMDPSIEAPPAPATPAPPAAPATPTMGAAPASAVDAAPAVPQDPAALAAAAAAAEVEQNKFQSQLDIDAWNQSIMQQSPADLANDVPQELSAAEAEPALTAQASAAPAAEAALSEEEAFAKLERIRSLEEERAEAQARVDEEFRRKRDQLESELQGRRASDAPSTEAV